MCVVGVGKSVRGDAERVLVPLGLQAVLSCRKCVLVAELRSIVQAASIHLC